MFKLPSTDQVRHLGEELGFDVTADYANSFINYIRPFADGFRLLAALPDDVPAIKHPRGAYYRPDGDENKYGAWMVKTHIKGAPNGRLGTGYMAAIRPFRHRIVYPPIMREIGRAWRARNDAG